MGTHLHIKEIDTEKEVEIDFLSVHHIEGYEIKKKSELEHLLEFHRMQWQSGHIIRKEHLNILQQRPIPQKTINWLISLYRGWENNVAFQNEEKATNRLNAASQMMEFELERHDSFGITPDRVRKILSVFKEGLHVAYTL